MPAPPSMGFYADGGDHQREEKGIFNSTKSSKETNPPDHLLDTQSEDKRYIVTTIRKEAPLHCHPPDNPSRELPQE